MCRKHSGLDTHSDLKFSMDYIQTGRRIYSYHPDCRRAPKDVETGDTEEQLVVENCCLQLLLLNTRGQHSHVECWSTLC